jgi:hypothetical protein
MRILTALLFAGGLATAAQAAGPIQPGLWEMRSVATDVDMPGAPPQMLQMMKKPQTIRHCITPDQASKGPQELLKQSQGQCKFSKYDFTGGRVNAVMQCNSGERGTMTVTTEGNFSPSSYATTSKMVMNSSRGTMRVTSNSTGKRIGTCKG